jgi:hypothetical protein
MSWHLRINKEGIHGRKKIAGALRLSLHPVTIT